jgi:thymidylate kinase
VREPGGTPAGERVRDLLKDAAVPLGGEAEALLFAAARAGESDRFEDEGAALQQAVLETYERLVAADPARWRRIDATRPPGEVHLDVLAEVEATRSGARA